VNCLGDLWNVTVDTDGWTGGGIVNMWETGEWYGWDEEHTLDLLERDPGGTWEILLRRMPDDAEVAAYRPDEVTVFSCGEHDINGEMTYMVRVYAEDGALSDCWLFGHDPGLVQAGGGPTYNLITDPNDILSCPVIQ